jgi:hypothetical protein
VKGSRASALLAATFVLLAGVSVREASAGPCDSLPLVFTGDPCDPLVGPYPIMPGLPLVLPSTGARGSWKDGPPTISTSFFGDVDLAVRVGPYVSAPQVPYPAGSLGGPSLFSTVAGGGGTAQGNLVPFTVFVTDGPGGYPYGSPLTGLDERPVAVFAYADLDDDGIIGATDTDGILDNELERQEALAQIGRQVGQIDIDRLVGSMAVRIGAPASIGGLRVGLSAGMYTGDDSLQLWSNGTPIFTSWPFLPPLDPVKIVFLDEPNPPDPSGPNILFYQTSEFFLPKPGEPGLLEAFAVHVDGSNPSTDQYVSVSGDAVGARLFRNVNYANFTPSSRLLARVAPTAAGPGRKLVIPAGEIAVQSGDPVEVRLLPVDSLGNIADPTISGFATKVEVNGGLRIVSPDLDGDPFAEQILLTTARGVTLFLATGDVGNGVGRLSVSEAPPVMESGLDQALVFASTSAVVDVDDDGIADDGDASGILGDHPCTPADLANLVPCDDNCPNVVNPAQVDTDEDGQGNCCDGTCVLDDGASGCMECPQAGSRFQGATTRARATIQPRTGPKPDAVRLRSLLALEEGQALVPDGESVELTIAEGDRLHYYVQLPGVFTLKNGRPTYVYEDPTGAIGGVLRAQIRGGAGGMRIRLLAKGIDLVDTTPGEMLPAGLVLAVTVGDDTFTRHLRCESTLNSIRCSSAD